MEFAEPVDLTAPNREIVRQVFENNPYWSFANPAMASLYLLEPGVDFTRCPTDEIFPRNQQNEDFVRQLIENGFEMDAGPALDTRYDGVQIYVENDVRADIRDGRLYRMFGIVRDVTRHRVREQHIQNELNEALDILTALPCGVVAFNSGCELVAVNPEGARLLKYSADDLLGGALSRDQRFVPVLDAVIDCLKSCGKRTLFGEDLDWSLASRGEGGVVASVSARFGRKASV